MHCCIVLHRGEYRTCGADGIRYSLAMLQNFIATSFDDNILEVVAVFGSVQLGISRVINLQRHRIAQVHDTMTHKIICIFLLLQMNVVFFFD